MKKEVVGIIGIINQKYGCDIAKSAKVKIENPPELIDFSPAHHAGIGGLGIPKGSWVILGGPPKSGKTTTALHLAKKCQRAGMKIRYLNVEGRIKKRDIEAMPGISMEGDDFVLIESTEEKILMGHEYLQIGQEILINEKNVCLIVDSFSALIDQGEYEGGIGTSTRGGVQKQTYQFCRNMSNVTPVKNNIVIAISQMMSNTSGYGAATIEKGGYGIKYQADVKLLVKSSKDIEIDGSVIGKEIEWVVGATPFNQPPMSKFTSYIRYGIGVDEVKELIELGVNTGQIEKGGAWYSFNGKKFQGIEKLCESLSADEKLFQELKKQVYSILL